ncbi:AraC family transcriptional regulator [Aquimarina sp. U1-2]|uniref:helix-turn-helix domain-containing protein n=1 Tax=Aquimarina sp. U1-2 TaxID=2823141 RepID=UPI001AECF8F1|nr:helix-turn-helix domain-containing protein [Aquimarina sp. U1-2]MBP2833091.1 AraC family transcriptional regulator [Aquimarina sp. U1-2]
MKHFSTLKEYCNGINIAPPKWDDFDLRSFEDNMKSVHHQMPPFKHEFYAIAIKIDGGGFATTGNYTTKDLRTTVFFNSPYQIISWDIAPDWKGYYIIFNEDFFRRSNPRKRITETFSFLLNDNTVPMEVTEQEAELFSKLFADIQFEFQLGQSSSKEVIAHYLHILLHKISRLYSRNVSKVTVSQDQRKQDLEIVSRFKTFMELGFQPGHSYEDLHPHQVQYYADKLNLHPNHFNAIVKRITDKSASEHIQQHLLNIAKSTLRNTNDSVKEIAFQLYYSYPNHFTNFFKKHTGQTPSQFRKASSK